MANAAWAKTGLVIASVGVVAAAICVAVVVLLVGEEERELPAVLQPEGKSRAATASARGRAGEGGTVRAREKAPSVPVPTRVEELEPVERAVVEVRFKNLLAFVRSLREIGDEGMPGLGGRALAILEANLRCRVEDLLEEGPALLVARKATETGFPAALSVPVKSSDAFLAMLEKVIGTRTGDEGGLVRFVRSRAAGREDLEVFARITGGRAVVSPDQGLLRELSGELAPPEADVWARIDPKGLEEAYGDELPRFLVRVVRAVPGIPLRPLLLALAMTRRVLRNMDELTVGLRIDGKELACAASSRAGEGSVLSRALGALVPLGGLDELKRFPGDCSVASVVGIDGRTVAGLVASGDEAPAAEGARGGAAHASTLVVGFGPGGKIAILAAMHAEAGEKFRRLFERAFSREIPVPLVGTMTLSYARGARKVGEAELDRARVTFPRENERLQALAAMFPWLFEFRFAFPPGVALASWGMDAGRLLDAATGRSGAGERTLADSGFYRNLPASVCAAGELYALRLAETIMPFASVFGGPGGTGGDISEFARKDMPLRAFGWKEGGTLHARLTVPRAALRLYGEAYRKIAAVEEDPGF